MTAPVSVDSQVEFTAAFEGPAVDAGRMSAKQFAGSVFALAELIEQAAVVEFDRENAVAIEIRADFRRGSFEFALVTGPIIPLAQHVFQSITPAGLLGFLRHIGVVSGISNNVLSLVKRIGSRPIEIRQDGDHNVALIYYADGAAQIITGVDPKVARCYEVTLFGCHYRTWSSHCSRRNRSPAAWAA